MATLKIGRVGTDVALSDLRTSRSAAGPGMQRVALSGWLSSSTLANVNALRSELLAQARMQGLPIAVTYSADPQLNGFYRMVSADVSLTADARPFGNFRYPFSVELEFLGTEAQVEFQSMMTGTTLSNNIGIIESEGKPFHAPPQGALSYSAGTTTVTSGSRTGAEGEIPVFFGLPFTADPTWSVTPANYYTGAVTVKTSGLLRAGLEAPSDITDSTGWELSNSLVKVTPSATTGQFDIAHHDGSQWETAKTYKLTWNDSAVIPSWHYFTIVDSRPERATVLCVRDANEAPPTAARHQLYLTLRRGSRLVEASYFYDSAVVLRIGRSASETSVAMGTPTGGTGSLGIRADANDGDGNRFVIGTNVAHTNGASGSLVTDVASTSTHFFIGSEIGGSSAVANDTNEDLQLQWLSQFNERCRAVLR